MTYQPSFDGIRAFSVLLVVLNHIGEGAPNLFGFVGVDIFFALSGYLITSLILDEKKRTGFFSLRAFYVRRVFRIVPLYYFMIFIYGVVSWYLEVHGNSNGKWLEFRAAFPYLVSFNSEYRPETAGTLFGQAWTLGIEEKFYLVWPLLFGWIGDSKRRFFIIVALGMAFLTFKSDFIAVRGYGGLAFGCLTAWFCSEEAFHRWLIGKGIIFLSMMLVGYVVVRTYALVGEMTLSFSSALFIASLQHGNEPGLSKALSFPPLVWLGKLTYGIYLVHVLVLNLTRPILASMKIPHVWWVHFLTTYLISVAVAYGLKTILEVPMIRVGHRISKSILFARKGTVEA